MYTFCCLTKFSSNFWMLFIGRIFGGISTSMLFSTFEAWYVYEHSEHYGFPSEWMGVTFSKTTFWNGLLAIFAGVLSNFVAETMGYGPVAPFALACIPLMICGGIVTTSWPENFGDRKLHFRASCHQGLREIIHDKKVDNSYGTVVRDFESEAKTMCKRVTFNSDKLGGIAFTKISKLTMCNA